MMQGVFKNFDGQSGKCIGNINWHFSLSPMNSTGNTQDSKHNVPITSSTVDVFTWHAHRKVEQQLVCEQATMIFQSSTLADICNKYQPFAIKREK